MVMMKGVGGGGLNSLKGKQLYLQEGAVCF